MVLTVKLTPKQKKAMIEEACQGLDCCHDELRLMRGKTIPQAMKIFDSWWQVIVLRKLAPKDLKKIRKNVIENLKGYLEDK